MRALAGLVACLTACAVSDRVYDTTGGPGYTIGGTIAGQTGDLVLRDNGGDDLPVAAGATSFAFATRLSDGTAYHVTIAIDPPWQTCTVSGGDGSVAGGDVTSIAISCAPIALEGRVTTVAGNPGWFDGTGAAAGLASPGAIAFDPAGNGYFVDTGNHLIRKIDPTGRVTTIAGGRVADAVDGVGTQARFNYPSGIACDGTNLYIADAGNNLIRKVVLATGMVTTLAGSTTAGYSDGIGTGARFAAPSGIAISGAYLYVADTGNNMIRSISIASAAVTTFVGTSGGFSQLSQPVAIAATGQDLYVTGYDDTVRAIAIATGAMTVLAGAVYVPGTTDGIGAAARFSSPQGIATDGVSVFVTDTNNATVRSIDIASGAVTTLAGPAGFSLPHGIAVFHGNLYVADTGNQRIRVVAMPSRSVTTLAGAVWPADGIGPAARLNPWGGIATDGTDLFVLELLPSTIRRMALATATVSMYAGQPGVQGSVDGVGTAATFYYPSGIARIGETLYVLDGHLGNIRVIPLATGEVSTWQTGIGSTSWPKNLATDGKDLFLADPGSNTVQKVDVATHTLTTFAGSPGGGAPADGIGTAARFTRPTGIASDGQNLYISDGTTIRQIVIATAAVTTLAGTPNVATTVDGIGASASFTNVGGVMVGGDSLYVTDTGTIRKIVIASREVTTLAGQVTTGPGDSVDGTGAAARFLGPTQLIGTGNCLYVIDGTTIRKVQ